MTEPNARPLTQQLREETSRHHQVAESGALQQSLMAGTLSREAYAESLAQQWIGYRELESLLRSLLPKSAALRSLVRDEHHHAKDLAADLKFFGRSVEDVVALPATEKFLKELREAAASNPESLIGGLYVFEGSMNGGRHIARRVRPAYGLDPASREGTSFLDPYGAEQPAKWGAFKAGLDALGLDAAGEARIVAMAQRVFEAIGAISSEVFERHAAAAK